MQKSFPYFFISIDSLGDILYDVYVYFIKKICYCGEISD